MLSDDDFQWFIVITTENEITSTSIKCIQCNTWRHFLWIMPYSSELWPTRGINRVIYNLNTDFLSTIWHGVCTKTFKLAIVKQFRSANNLIKSSLVLYQNSLSIATLCCKYHWRWDLPFVYIRWIDFLLIETALFLFVWNAKWSGVCFIPRWTSFQ